MRRAMINEMNPQHPYHSKKQIPTLIKEIGVALRMTGGTQKFILEVALNYIIEGNSSENIQEVISQNQFYEQKITADGARIQELEKKLREADALISQMRRTSSFAAGPANDPMMHSGYNPSMMYPPQQHQQSHFPQQAMYQRSHVFPQHQLMNPMMYQSQMGQYPSHNGFNPMVQSGSGYQPHPFAQLQPIMHSFPPPQMAAEAHSHPLDQQYSTNQIFPGAEEMPCQFSQQAPQQQLPQECPQASYFFDSQQQFDSVVQPQPNLQMVTEADQLMEYPQPLPESSQADCVPEQQPESNQVLALTKAKVEHEAREKQAPETQQTHFVMAKLKIEHDAQQAQSAPEPQSQQDVFTLAKVKVERENRETDLLNQSQLSVVAISKVKNEHELQQEQKMHYSRVDVKTEIWDE